MSGKPTILCIDDNRPGLLARTELLKMRGYNVIPVTGHSSALKAITEQQVDLAVIDYHLAEDSNGELVAQDIRAMYPDLPLLMLTGDPNVPQSARDSVDVCIIKGVEPVSTLLSVIKTLLSENRVSENRAAA